MSESEYNVYNGDDPKVKGRVLEAIFSTLAQITGSDRSSFTEESEVARNVWTGLRDKLVITHQFIVRDSGSYPVKIKDMLKNISFAMN